MKTRTSIFNRAIGPAATALALSCGLWSAAADQYSTAVLTDHPLALWQLNDTSGTTALDSVGGHNGVYTNVVLSQPGYTQGTDPLALSTGFGAQYGQSSDSYAGGLALDFATNANAECSAEAWVQGYSQTAGAGIFGKGTGSSGEQFYLDCGGTGGAFRFFARTAAGTATNASSSVVPDGNWHYLVGVVDQVNNKLLLYVDAVQVASTPMTGGLHASANANMQIGSRQSAASGSYDFQFSGAIANVAAYNYALTPAQILAHYYAAGIPPVITVQPTNSVTVNEGGTLTLSVTATGNPVLDYNWNDNGTLQDGTNSTLTITNVSASLNGTYIYVTASNAFGQVQSQGTQITVNSGAPSVQVDVGPPQLNLFNGIVHTYAVAVTGTVPVYYQWLLNGTAIPGATNATYAATAATGSASYSVAISNNFSGGSITLSSTAVLNGVTVPTNAYPTAIIADHPSAYYRLGEGTGASTASDNIGGHDGTYNSIQLGVPGYSSSFDTNTAGGFGILATSDSYVGENVYTNYGIPQLDFAVPSGSNSQFTVEAWVNGPANQMAGGSCIVAKGIAGTEEFVMDASGAGGVFRFFIRKANNGGTAQINTSTPPDGNWHYLVAVCDEVNATISLYVDGVIGGQVGALGLTGLNASTTPLSIGAQNSGFDYTYQFNGTIDEVATYNYALTGAQITAHYNAAPLPPYFTSLPATNVTAYPGQNVSLSALVLGSAPRTNQWYSNSVALPGQTNVSLTITNVQPGTYTYYLKVSNAFGSSNTPSTVVTAVAGSGPPTVVKDLQDTARYTTLPLTYTINAVGTSPLYYYWTSNSTLVAAGTNASFTIPSVSLGSAGSYQCLVSNSLGSIESYQSTLVVAPIPTNAYPKLIMNDHPVAYFRLDETNSTMSYDYFGGNEGQYVNLSSSKQGVPGYNTNIDSDLACWFNATATNSYLGNSISNVTFAKPNGQNGTFSVEVWVNGTNSGPQHSGACIVAKGAGGFEQFSLDAHLGYRFYCRNTANVTVAGAQTAPTLGGSVITGNNWQMDGKWHYVVGVCDQANSNVLMYVDGALIGANIVTNGVVPPFAYAYDLGIASNGTNGIITPGTGITEPTNTYINLNTISIGERNKSVPTLPALPTYNLPFRGIIDEVALYDYVLTPAQVANHYNTALGIATQVPILFHVTNGQLVLTWTAGTLLSSSTPNGTYTVVAGAVSPYTVPITGTQQYFRLKLN